MNTARAILLALLVGWVFPALADVAVPPLTGRVVDQTGTLSAGNIASLTQTLKDLETENARLRKAISDLTLDKLILQEAARGNY